MEVILVSKVRLLVIGALAVMAFTAVSAAQASALSFKWTGGTPLAASATETEAFVLSATGQPEIKCTGISTEASIAKESSSDEVKAIDFTSCEDKSSPTTCAVAEPIVVKPTTLALSGTASAAIATFTPVNASKEFTVIELKNKGEASCALKGTKLKVTGKATSTAANDSALAKTHPLSFNVLSSSEELKYAEKPASFKGSANIAIGTVEWNVS